MKLAVTDHTIGKWYERVGGGIPLDDMIKLQGDVGIHMCKKAIYDQEMVPLPNMLGTLYLRSYYCDLITTKPGFFFTMNDLTKDKKDRSRFSNASTFGYYYKLRVLKAHKRIKNKAYYWFKEFSDYGATSGVVSGKLMVSKFIKEYNTNLDLKMKRK